MALNLARFEGSLTARDCKRNIPLSFTVPHGCSRLDITFEFSPERMGGYDNLITLTVFDPEGFRGAGHRGGSRHEVVIEVGSATPGYLAGPLPRGEWIVELDTHRIMPGSPVRYALAVTAGMGGDVATPPVAVTDAVAPRGPGWYRGDLHTHTHHSDAEGFSVADLVATARYVGLDFVFLTDHNTTAGLQALDALSSPALLTAGGIELTTFWGHALRLGGREWVDWRVQPCTRAMAHIAARSHALDRLFIIAHPMADGDPGCTGCAWRFGDMMPDNARLVEIWNGPWDCDSNNEAALSLWYDWLNQGMRLVATAGSDYHGEPFAREGEGGVSGGGAMPAAWTNVGFSVVYAEALTEAALLAAIGAGHLYLSAGPVLDFEAHDPQGKRWIIGDTLPEGVTGPVDFTLSWTSCPPGADIRVVVNGRPLRTMPAHSAGEYRWQMRHEDADWVVVEIRDSRGQMLAITNPIFLSEAPVASTSAC